jgi:hypothetical protein
MGRKMKELVQTQILIVSIRERGEKIKRSVE